MEHKKITLAMIEKCTSLPLLQGWLRPISLQGGEKVNKLKCFIVCLENEIATPQQWHKWRHNAYVLAKVGVIKELKLLEIKATSTMAQVEAQCLPFWPRWV
jgi:hypothetical protein